MLRGRVLEVRSASIFVALVAVALSLMTSAGQADDYESWGVRLQGMTKAQEHIYLAGFIHGIHSTVAHMQIQGPTEWLYCAPDDFTLTPNKLRQLVASRGSTGTMNRAIFRNEAISALRSRFPCR